MNARDTRKRKLSSSAGGKEEMRVTTTTKVILPPLPEVLGALEVFLLPPICMLVAAYCNTVVLACKRSPPSEESDIELLDCYTGEIVWAEKYSMDGIQPCLSPLPGLALQTFAVPHSTTASDKLETARSDFERFAAQRNKHLSAVDWHILEIFELIAQREMRVGEEFLLPGHRGRIGMMAWLKYEQVGDFELVIGAGRSEEPKLICFSFNCGGDRGSFTQLFVVNGVTSMLFHQKRPNQLLACFVFIGYDDDRKTRVSYLCQTEVRLSPGGVLSMKLLSLHEMRDEKRLAFVTQFPVPMLVCPTEDPKSWRAWKLEFGSDGVLKQKFESSPFVLGRSSADDLRPSFQRGPIRSTRNEMLVQVGNAVRLVKESNDCVETSTLMATNSTLGAKAQFENL